MSSTTIRSLVLLPFLSAAFLQAQMDTRLQACKTDVLDVYSGGKLGSKPEIVTLIDDSGSTLSLAWDSRFYTNVDANIHVAATSAFGSSTGDNSYGSFEIVQPNTSPIYTNIPIVVNFSYDGNYKLRRGLLIKPDGTPVTLSDVDNSYNYNKWVARASHVRFVVTSKASSTNPTYSYGGVTYAIPAGNCGIQPRTLSTSGTYTNSATDIDTSDNTRVIDIPLPWAVFDRVPNCETGTRSPSLASGVSGLSTAIADKHPQHMYLYDNVPDATTGATGSTAQYYEVDTTWWQTTGGTGGYNGNLVSAVQDMRIHPEYLAWCFFGQDIRNQSETGAFQGGMIDKFTTSSSGYSGSYTVGDARDGAAGFLSFTRDGTTWTGNGLPAMTRFQAIKYSIIKTWINEQNNVWWAIRFLNLCGSGGGFTENGRSSGSECYNSANEKGNPGDRMLLRLAQPTSASNPDTNMRYIQRMFPNKNTPLTFGLLNTYAQVASTDTGTNGSVFNANKTESPIPSCRRSFVIVLSDGNPNDDAWNCNNGGGSALGTGDPFSAGSFPTVNFGMMSPTKSYFNIWSLAGLAAHLTPSASDAKTKTNWTTDADNAKVLPPFLVTTRPSGTTRRISTMTIGVSMVGMRTDATGAKRAMYRTALYGWEQRGDYSVADLPLPYDKNNSSRNDKGKNPFFFDAQSPEGIADALAEAFAQARTVTNTMSAPVTPLVGLGVGRQMYVGTFTTAPDTAAWKGDLLMTGMKVSGGTVTLLDKGGDPLTGGVNIDSAVWSASVMLKDTANKGWKKRNLYTLKPDPDNAGKFLTTLLPWNESTLATDLPNSVIGVDTTAKRLSLIRFMMGASEAAQADTDSVSTNLAVRNDIMGDIIDSTPAIMEFPLSKVPSTGILASFLASNTSLTDKHFRLIIVGDNQGILHGFGEVSGFDSEGKVAAAVDELWGIIPPDVLRGLQAWRTGTIHLYQVDGSPVAYMNEQPTVNGLVDGNDVVRVVFGLGKGGRSYYALSFTNNLPDAPFVKWMVRPDDIASTATGYAAISKMGFSTSTPATARVYVGSALKDVVFLTGGLSTTDVEAAFGTTSNPVKLGRSVIAVNLYDGSVVKVWDFLNDSTLKTAYPNMGCIPEGVVPVEVLQGSYKTQRAYFSDFSGGIYALGTKATSGSRTDSSNMNDWSMRTIFKTRFTNTSISSSPAVFALPFGYPITRTSAPTARVATLGVVVGMGDRNDPMDLDTVNPGGGGTTYRNRLVMVLDRQDSADITNASSQAVDAAGYSESDLADLTSVSYATSSSLDVITEGNANYYLKTKFGYYLNYAVGTVKPDVNNAWYYEKSVTSPIVLNSALYFSKFAPLTTAGVCSGAGGTTYTYRMCNVINPVYGNGTVAATDTASACSGYSASYNDIPSELATVGIRAVIQVGEVQVADQGIGTVVPTVIKPPSTIFFPRPRAWRVIR
jgi:hypothetical protein